MNGSELRAWRTSRGLFQRDLVRIANEAGMAAVDQPTISEFERGLADVPAELDAALAAVAPDYPVTGAPTPAAAPRKARKRKPEPVEQQDDGDELEQDDADRDDGEPEPVEQQADRAPRPVTPPGAAEQHRRGVAWDREVRNQLERDLRTLFAGDTFLVPVPVQQADGSVVDHMETAAVPGIAQLVGFVEPYDGRVIEMHAPQMARAWAELADESPAVRRWLILLTYGGAWRGVMAATLPVIYSMAVHHGIIPPVLGGAGAAPQTVEPAAADAAGVA